MTKQYIGVSRDHSGSMRNIATAAMKDYNRQIEAIRSASDKHLIDTIVSVVNCGIKGNLGGRGVVERAVQNSSVYALKPMSDYPANGASTPLFDSVLELINILQSVPDYHSNDVSFLIQVITDGYNNDSKITGQELGRKIHTLQSTDKWSFTFRVPRGNKSVLTSIGIPEGNILEWDQTNQGMDISSAATTQAYDKFYTDRTKGLTSTRGFYSDLSKVTSSSVKKKLTNITQELNIYSVDKEGEAIQKFVERKTNAPLVKGTVFYELTKYERAIQDHKQIAIQDLKQGGFYSGKNARSLLGLPETGSVSISPGDHAHYKIFVQSTSINRKLKKGTSVLHWPSVR